jgi:hypothetical protein
VSAAAAAAAALSAHSGCRALRPSLDLSLPLFPRHTPTPPSLSFAEPPPGPGSLAGQRGVIDRCFGPALSSVAAVMDALAAAAAAADQDLGHPAGASGAAEERRFAGDALAKLRAACPTSAAVALFHLRSAARVAGGFASLEDTLAAEYRAAVRMAARPDFAKGVAAALARPPGPPAEWDPPASAGPVAPAAAEALFATGGVGELLDGDSDPLRSLLD